MNEVKKYMYRVGNSSTDGAIERLEVIKETDKMVFYKNKYGCERHESKSCDWQIWSSDLPQAVQLCQDRIDRLRMKVDKKQEALNFSIIELTKEA